MQCEDGEFVATKPGCQIAVTHSPEKALRHNGKNLISNTMAINIIHLFEAIQVEKDQSVHRTFSWWSSDRSLKRIIKLSPIGKPGQRILKSKRADMLFCRETEGGFPPLFKVSPYREGQKTQSHNPAQKQSFIELDCALVHAHAIRVFEQVILECQVEADEKDSHEDGEIFETGTIPDHETP
jgi:hypothetical protein